MKKILLVWLVIVLLALACSFSASTANIAAATLAKDTEGHQPATVFDQDDVIYALVTLQNAPDDTTLKAVWTAVEADGTDPNLMIDETTITSGDDIIQSVPGLSLAQSRTAFRGRQMMRPAQAELFRAGGGCGH